jgi:hypothetical protein
MSVRRTEVEAASLRATWTRDLLDSQPELECEELVRLAASLCGTPLGLVTLLDERHQWYREDRRNSSRGGLLRSRGPAGWALHGEGRSH